MIKRGIFMLMLVLLAELLLCRAGAIQLGDSRTEIEGRYDTAPSRDRPKGVAIYRWDLWKLQIQYTDEVAHSLVYSKLDPVTDEEINTLLEQNGGLARWRTTGSAEGRAVAWTRTDGATAVFDPKGHSITLRGGKLPVPAVIAATPVLQSPAVPSNPQGVLQSQAQAQSPTVKPVAIAPVMKAIARPVPSSAPEKPNAGVTPNINVRLNPTPVSILWPMVAGAAKQKPVYFGIALIVAGLVLRGILKAGKSGAKSQAARPFADEDAGDAKTAQGKPLALYMVPALETLTWQQFELLMGEVFRRQGYAVEISSGDGADGGVDLRLNKDGALVLVQCKQYLSEKVSVGAIREFYGVIKSENAARGIFINTSVYTSDALNFARNNEEMELLDKEGVRALIAGVTKPGENIYDIQQWLAEFTSEATIVHPNCQFCESPMVLRTGKDKSRFWGCPGYPQCTGTRDARMELVGNLVRSK